uniref:Uncharacterized protein n=1 Tax=Arundo donax TaxID=35708 RepID=A0A0A9D6S4_ARUDO
MKTSPCVSSIIMSSVNKSSWEKLKISVTCRSSYKSHSLNRAIRRNRSNESKCKRTHLQPP